MINTAKRGRWLLRRPELTEQGMDEIWAAHGTYTDRICQKKKKKGTWNLHDHHRKTRTTVASSWSHRAKHEFYIVQQASLEEGRRVIMEDVEASSRTALVGRHCGAINRSSGSSHQDWSFRASWLEQPFNSASTMYAIYKNTQIYYKNSPILQHISNIIIFFTSRSLDHRTTTTSDRMSLSVNTGGLPYWNRGHGWPLCVGVGGCLKSYLLS